MVQEIYHIIKARCAFILTRCVCFLRHVVLNCNTIAILMTRRVSRTNRGKTERSYLSYGNESSTHQEKYLHDKSDCHFLEAESDGESFDPTEGKNSL